MDIFNTLFFSFLIGILPAAGWLIFWLQEDNAHPEPPRAILKTFAYGALSVPFALVAQLTFNFIFSIETTASLESLPFFTAFAIILVWAFTEEYVKYKAAWNGGLRHNVTDEAVDVPIYMISAALGFAAVENSLYVLAPMFAQDWSIVYETTKIRFIGASLVHVASSALIGLFVGYSLFFMKSIRRRYLGVGFMLATVLHALFNLFIIKHSQNSFAGFLLIWLFVVLIIVLFERIKKIKVNTIDNV